MALKIVTSQDFESDPIDEGVYETVVTKLEERKRFNRFNNADEIGISIEFTIISEGPMKDKKAYRFFTPYITANSKLKVLCVAVMGREFEAEELASIEGTVTLAKFIGGLPVQIIVKQRTSQKGTVYYNVSDFVRSANVGVKSNLDVEVTEISAEDAAQPTKQAQEAPAEAPADEVPHPAEPTTASSDPIIEATAEVPTATPKEAEDADKLAEEVDEGIKKEAAKTKTKTAAKPASDEDIEKIFGAKKATPKKA